MGRTRSKRPSCRRRQALNTDRCGVTLVEMMIALAVVGALSAIAMTQYLDLVRTTDRSKAIADIKQFELKLARYELEFKRLPLNLSEVVNPVPLDPWGNPYQYLNLEAGAPGTNGKRRRDKNMNPINSDYDLYSSGPDGRSQPQLVAAKARDDIVRAANGDFVGIAEDF